jgi:hypothetical protein
MRKGTTNARMFAFVLSRRFSGIDAQRVLAATGTVNSTKREFLVQITMKLPGIDAA